MNPRTVRIAVFFSLLFSIGLPLRAATPKEKASRSESNTDNGRDGVVVPVDYVLQPQDLIRVQVLREEEINKQGEVSISQENTVFLPLIGTISLKGKTPRQAEEMIRNLYDRDYLVNPQVSVIVLKYAERSVNVVGAVNKAGRVLFPQERGLTIVDAISLADGQNRYADLKKVKLTRYNADGEQVTITVNVDEIMKGGGRDPVPLQKDDVIFVPERIL